MKRKILLTLILTIILSFTFATPALAQDSDGRVVFGGNLTLKPEEKIKGDVVVFGGNATVPASSKIDGSLVVFGGNANIDGKIEGDIAMFGGNINLGETAEVEGDVGLAGGQATVADGAKIEGSIVEFNGDQGFTPPIPPIPRIPPIPEVPEIPSPPDSEFSGWDDQDYKWDKTPNFFERIGRSMVLLLALAVVSWLVATFMPQQMKTVGDTIVEATIASFGVGLLTAIIVAASFLLVFTICLAFIPPIAFLLAGVAALFGWIVIGQIIGERLLIATGRSFPNFILSTMVGVTALTVVATMPVLSWIDCIAPIFWCIGWLVIVIVGSIGLGAVILTRFGTRPYDPASLPTPGNPPPPPPRPRPSTWRESDFSDLDVAAASEAELKAKIKAALDEAEAVEAPEAETPGEEPAETEETPPEKPKRKKRTTKKKPTDETPPAPEEPPTDTPDDEEPDLNA
jgi:cytoskeletal protein CcmA (bactofilin family)